MNRIEKPSSLARAVIVVSTVVAPGCAPDGSMEPQGDIASNVERLERPARAEVEREWFVTRRAPEDLDLFRAGHFVGLSGDTAVVSAMHFEMALVFVRSDDGWQEQARLTLPPGAQTNFGESVAISGDTIVVGGTRYDLPGQVYVYDRSGTSWSPAATLSADDGTPGSAFGRSVAISGDTVVVGDSMAASYDANGGAVYVFTRAGSSWTQTRKLVATSDNAAYNGFGYSVAIAGATILVGAPTAPIGEMGGRAYFFTLSGGNWSQQEVGLAVANPHDAFGLSVALDEDIAVIGAPGHAGRLEVTWMVPTGSGAAFAYGRSHSGWAQTDALFPDDGESEDGFGTSVAVSGGTVMVGAPGLGTERIGADTVYVFDPLLGQAVQGRIGARGGEIPYLGGSLALEGGTAVIGTLTGNGAYIAELLVPGGGPCDEDSDCEDRQCIAGTCCDQACSGECETCETGTCVALPQDPGTPSCSPYLCTESGGGCPTHCVANSHCVDTHYCHEGECVERLRTGGSCTEARACVSGNCSDGRCAGMFVIGEGCSNATECESGNCVNGFCCDQRCRGQCEACDLRGKHGICSPVPRGAPRGERAPCDGTDTECGGECDGEHTVGCDYPDIDVGCGTSCTDGVQTDSVCNGQGACETLEPHSCENFACADELVCKTTCELISDCMPAHTCQNGRCEASATCLDAHTSQGTDGMEQDCSPYVCEEGSCRTSCESPDDCDDDSACDGDGDCVTRPTRNAVSTNDGCGCRIRGRRSPQPPWTVWALTALTCLLMRIGLRRPRA